MNVTIYNEFCHEKTEENVKKIYPNGLHMTLKEAIEDKNIQVRTFTLDNIDELTEEVLLHTDVMLWWGHMKHQLVPDEVAQNVQKAVLDGMGIIFLHSAHFSKPFRLLMGTPCSLGWRCNDDHEYLWVVDPSHPIAKGLGRYVFIEQEEVYSEPFYVPEPDKLVFIASYEGGEVFRAGCCYKRGLGNVFYFQPGHEGYPTYHHPEIIKIIKNAIEWAKPTMRANSGECPHIKKIEE